jgi:hypothetical protein
MHTSERRRQQFRHERTSFGIGHARQVTARFVEKHVNLVARLELRVDELAVDLDVVALGIRFAAKLFDDGAVNRHTTGDDEFFGVPARGDACRGNEFL